MVGQILAVLLLFTNVPLVTLWSLGIMKNFCLARFTLALNMLETHPLLYQTYPIITSPWPGLWQVYTHFFYHMIPCQNLLTAKPGYDWACNSDVIKVDVPEVYLVSDPDLPAQGDLLDDQLSEHLVQIYQNQMLHLHFPPPILKKQSSGINYNILTVKSLKIIRKSQNKLFLKSI